MSYIHYNSFKNFFENFDCLKSTDQFQIEPLLENYVMEIDENKYNIDRPFAFSLIAPYLFSIGKVYKDKLNFKEIIKFRHAMIAAIIVDIALCLFGLSIAYNTPIPIITIVTAIYYIAFLKPSIKRGAVFGIFF